MRRLQAVLYYCGCFMYFCPMIENLCKNTAFAQKTTWHKKGGAAFLQKGLAKKPKIRCGGDAHAVPAPVPVQGAEKVERARKKTCIRHAQAIQCQCMWAPPYDAGEAMALARPPPPRARWRTRTAAGKAGGRGNNANTGRCGENCRACGLFCATCAGFPYLAKNGGCRGAYRVRGQYCTGRCGAGLSAFLQKGLAKNPKKLCDGGSGTVMAGCLLLMRPAPGREQLRGA